jgi:hypothetical protein
VLNDVAVWPEVVLGHVGGQCIAQVSVGLPRDEDGKRLVEALDRVPERCEHGEMVVAFDSALVEFLDRFEALLEYGL